jgi:hypothetical protein
MVMIIHRSIFLLFITISLQLSSQTKLRTDFKDYTFSILSTSNVKYLDVQTQHAQVNLLNWDKDSVSVETTIEVISNKPNLAKEMLDEIQVSTKRYLNSIQVKTGLSKNFSSTIPYKITYTIFHPKHLSLNIDNTHGIVKISEVQGGTTANLAYCDVTIKNLKCKNDSIENTIELKYCKGKINKIGNTSLGIKNSEVEIVSAKKISINSEYTILSVNKIATYTGNSLYDQIQLGQLDSININCNTSNLIVKGFNSYAKFRCIKGQLNIKNSGDLFSQLIIDNKNTETNIHLSANASYTLHGEIENGNFSHPKLNNFQQIKEGIKTSVSGEVGNSNTTAGNVIIFNQNQNINFK